MKPWSIAICLSALLLLQDVRLADCQGEVRDMQGRPIAGALVVYTLKETGKTYSVKTDSNGQYHVIGLMLGWYNLEITGPTGKHIYSGKKFLSAGNAQKLNVTQINLSTTPPKASLVPFKGPKADEMRGAREKSIAAGKKLSPAELAELRAENGLISRYNEMVPEAQAAIKAEDWKRAAEMLQQLIAIAPYKWELYQNLGTIQRYLGQFEASVRSLEKGLQVVRDEAGDKPDHAVIKAAEAQMLMAQGEAYVALGKPEAAVGQFRRAAELDAKPAIAYLHLCTAEYNSGHEDAAVIACAQAIAAEPGRTESYQVMAGVENSLERYQDALRTYGKGLAAVQANVHANNSEQRILAEVVRAGQMLQSAGNIYFQLKNYPKAAEFFSRSAKFHPYPALPLFNLCATLYDMDNLSAAVVACSRAIEADSKIPEPYFVKASALYGEAARHGKFKGSREMRSALEKYLQLAPEGFYANEARAMLKEMGGPQ